MTANGDHYHLISRDMDIDSVGINGRPGPDTVGDFDNTNILKTSTSGNHTHDISSVGGDEPHENRQPYVVVNRWKRTA